MSLYSFDVTKAMQILGILIIILLLCESKKYWNLQFYNYIFFYYDIII